MMNYREERDRFIARMTTEGLDIDTTRRLLRAATTLQRYAELACSSEAADRDRVPCPATKTHKPGECLCDAQPSRESAEYPSVHETVPRITVLDHRLEVRVRAAMPAGWGIATQGDPRGAVLRVIPPSYAERNKGRDRCNLETLGVPSGPTRLRF